MERLKSLQEPTEKPDMMELSPQPGKKDHQGPHTLHFNSIYNMC